MKTLRLIFLFVSLGSITGCAGLNSSNLEPFTTNGCSLFPDRKILSCCTEHDIDYWQGGSFAQRKSVDQQFRSCVLEKTGSGVLSAFAYSGVRVGGSPYWPPSAGWGYGWAFGRGYTALSVKEKALIKIEIAKRLKEYGLQCNAGDQQSCEVEMLLSRRYEIDGSDKPGSLTGF